MPVNPLREYEHQLHFQSRLSMIQDIFLKWDSDDKEVIDKLMDILDILENRLDEGPPDDEDF